MSKENTKVVYKGLGLLNILTIIFVIAKICGAITWSWWLVLLPTIINVGLTIVTWLVILIVVIIATFLD